VFAGAEIAVLSIRKTRLMQRVEEGSRRARAVKALREQPERFLATVQIGITVVGATAAVLSGQRIEGRVEAWLQAVGAGSWSDELGFAVVVAGLSYLSLVIGELVPKSLALRYSEGYAMVSARPLLGLSMIARPFVWLLVGSSNVVLRLFGDRTTFTESRLTPEELQQLVEEAAKSGSLDPRAGEIASRAFDFGSLMVADCMVPRSQIVAVPRRSSAEEVRRVLLEEGHSRMPVYDGNLNHIVGYIIAKDVLALSWEKDLIVLEDILRPIYLVPETMRAVDVLQELRRRRTQMAIVGDEDGAVAGLVTIEDIVEELVGEIFSEHEAVEELIRREPDGSALVQGTVPIRDINRELNLALPEGDGWSTVAGLCIHLAGWIPSARDKLATADGTVLEVLDASPRRVRMIKIHPPPPKGTGTESERDREREPDREPA
jgi:putative hemolysin